MWETQGRCSVQQQEQHDVGAFFEMQVLLSMGKPGL